MRSQSLKKRNTRIGNQLFSSSWIGTYQVCFCKSVGGSKSILDSLSIFWISTLTFLGAWQPYVITLTDFRMLCAEMYQYIIPKGMTSFFQSYSLLFFLSPKLWLPLLYASFFNFSGDKNQRSLIWTTKIDPFKHVPFILSVFIDKLGRSGRTFTLINLIIWGV